MPSANALRLQIERTLENRFPAALSPVPQTMRETAATGIAEIDSLLSGGFPVGAISEITGPATSGRTCLALAFIAERTSEGKVCAWIDVNDALDPESAAANGVQLRRLLWVRCKSKAERANGKPWSRLEQALRAVDLLLQAGGFAAIVLDMGDIAAEHGSRIPLATWYRFHQAAEQSRCCLVVLGARPMRNRARRLFWNVRRVKQAVRRCSRVTPSMYNSSGSEQDLQTGLQSARCASRPLLYGRLRMHGQQEPRHEP